MMYLCLPRIYLQSHHSPTHCPPNPSVPNPQPFDSSSHVDKPDRHIQEPSHEPEYILKYPAKAKAGQPKGKVDPKTNKPPKWDSVYKEWSRTWIKEHSTSSIWMPFASELEWKLCQWASSHGLSKAAVDDLLQLPKVCHHFF